MKSGNQELALGVLQLPDYVNREISTIQTARTESPLMTGELMARWPRNTWTTIFTYGAIFVLFPLLSLLAYAWVTGQWIF